MNWLYLSLTDVSSVLRESDGQFVYSKWKTYPRCTIHIANQIPDIYVNVAGIVYRSIIYCIVYTSSGTDGEVKGWCEPNY